MDSKRVHIATSDTHAIDADAQRDGSSGHTLVARSERNVGEWMSYLPQDCVETMIRMGWDIST